METRTALLLGASGLVGGHCLDLLLADESYGRVVSLGRRSLPRQHPKLEQHPVDFERLEEHADLVRGDDVFCCLGTTIRKSGSEEAFRRIDLGYPAETARLSARNGAKQFLLVSTIGAHPGSRIFYNRVKGEAEAAVRQFPFEGVVILRPSLLLGDREESRPGEAIAQKVVPLLSPLLRGPLRRYRAVPARDVAVAMVGLAAQRPLGVTVVESDRITEIVVARVPRGQQGAHRPR